MIQIGIIEDNPNIRRNTSTFIKFFDDLELLIETDSVESFLRDVQSNKLEPDVLLLDIGLPGMTGLEGIKEIKDLCPDLDIIMLTSYEEEEKIVRALTTGACSYLSKKTPLREIVDTIRIVHEGGSYMSPGIARKLTNFLLLGKKESTLNLSPKQEEVIQGLVDGLSYKGIAEKLEISVETVKTHIKRIYEALHVNSKAQAVAKYLADQKGSYSI